MPLDITNHSIKDYIATLLEPRKEDLLWLIEQMEKITKRKPKLWGSIVGFGKLYYRYPTGNDGYMPILAFANRKQAITLYLSFDIAKFKALTNLGKYTIGKSCLYLKSLNDIHREVLITIMEKAYEETMNYNFIKVIE
jgi:hypothetical protein